PGAARVGQFAARGRGVTRPKESLRQGRTRYEVRIDPVAGVGPEVVAGSPAQPRDAALQGAGLPGRGPNLPRPVLAGPGQPPGELPRRARPRGGGGLLWGGSLNYPKSSRRIVRFPLHVTLISAPPSRSAPGIPGSASGPGEDEGGPVTRQR